MELPPPPGVAADQDSSVSELFSTMNCQDRCTIKIFRGEGVVEGRG